MKRLMTAFFLGGLAALIAPARTAEAACPTIVVDPVSLPNGAVTQPYSQSVTQTGGTGATFSITSGVLPTGLAMNATGNVTGTPTATGTFVFTATATDSTGCTGGRTFVVAINQAPAITSANNTTFQPDGTPKSFTVTTTGVPTPALSSTGTLPGTITFTDNGNGTASIAGTPNAANVGAHPITITANNGVPPNATQNFTLNITCPAITVNIPGANTFTVGQALAGGLTFTQTGGTAGGTFTVATGSLPNGVTLSSGGTLSGTPTQTGSFPITVRYTAPGGCTGTSATYNLQINCPTITVNRSSLTDALFGQAYGPVAFTQTGSTGSSFTWTSSALPGAGLAFSTGGSLAGTPTNTGQTNVTFTVTDNFACQGQRTINGFAARPVANPDTFNNGVGNTQYVVAAVDPGGTPHVFVSGNILTNDAAPPGLRTSTPASPPVGGIGGTVALATNGTFTYTPPLNTAGAATFNYTLTDVNGITNTALVTIHLANMVWYVTSGGTGDGRSNTPLGNVGAAATAASLNQSIFVHSPSGTPSTFAGAVTLKSGQTIWGQGTTFTLGGLTINPALPTPTKPVIQGTLNLAIAVTVSSLDVSAGTSNGIVGTGTGAAHLSNVTIKNDIVVTTTTGTAVSLTFVDATTSPGNGITFRSVSANGAPSGILLSNVTGAFTVTGDAGTTANGSGGAILNTTGNGISMTGAQNVSIQQLNVSGSGGHGVHASSVAGLSLTGTQVSNAGNGDNEHGLNLVNVSGTIGLSGVVFNGASEDLVHLENANTNATFNVSNASQFSYPAAVGGFANSAILLLPGGTTALNVSIQNASFTNIRNLSAQIGANLAGSNGTQAFDFSNNTVGVSIAGRSGGVAISGQEQTVSNLTISGNTFNGAGGNGVISIDTNDTSTVTGSVSGNVITNPPGIGMFVAGDEGSTTTLTVSNNTVTNSGSDGIQMVNFGGAGVSTLNLTVTNNQVNGNSNSPTPGIAFVGGISMVSFEDNTCLQLTGNTVTGTNPGPTQCGGAPCVDYYLEEVGGVMRLEEVPNTGATVATVPYVQSINNPATASVTIFGTIDLTNGVQCP